MTCQNTNYIKIFRGDDTNWNGQNLLNFVVSSQTANLATMTARFIVGEIVFDNISLANQGAFSVNLTHDQTDRLPWGFNEAILQILDSQGRIKTVSNTIPLYITNQLFEEQTGLIRVKVPDGSPVDITLQVGVAYATQDALDLEIGARQQLQTQLQNKQNSLTTAQLAAVNSGITSETVSQVQTNKENIAVIDAQLDANRPWSKPADWLDIRSGALNNSIYFLVGHKADYSQYAKFAVLANVSTAANTYDVYVDGIKQATASSGAVTTLDWQTLALTSGYEVTYPAALHTHIVRVTPTVSTDTLTRIQNAAVSAQTEQGTLWCHFQISNAIGITGLFGDESSKRNYLLEAVTAKDNKIIYTVSSTPSSSGFYAAFANCSSLVQIPILEADSTTYASGTYLAFAQVPAKKVVIRNNKGTEELGFLNQTHVQEFDIENGCILGSGCESLSDAHAAVHLKQLPALQASAGENFQIYDVPSLQETFIDDSTNTSRSLFRFCGTSTASAKLKGLIVCNAAPFNGESPQIKVSYTYLDRAALVSLFNSMPTVTDSQVCDITGATGAANLTAADLAIATDKGWTIVR